LRLPTNCIAGHGTCLPGVAKASPSGNKPDGLDQELLFFVGGGVFVIFFFVIFFRPSLPILILLIFLDFLPQPPLSLHPTPLSREKKSGAPP